MSQTRVLIVYSVLICLIVRSEAIENNCLSEGFYATKSEDCRGFHYCAYSADGGFEVVAYECPEGEEFMPIERRCVPDERYECGKNSVEDPDVERDPLDHFICPSQGRFPNPESIDCRSYYVCVTGTSNDLVAILTNCPSSTLYSMTDKKCVLASTFTCPSAMSTTTEAIAETETTSSPTTEPNGFVCPGIGRYPNPTSTDCKSYYTCSTSPEGEFIAQLVRCPGTTVFSPESKKCVTTTEYQCPTIGTSTSAQPSTEPTTIPSGFICPGDGRYPDTESQDCTTYYLCIQDTSGATTGTLTNCPASTIFSWVVNKCVPTNQFSCPNTKPSTEESTTQVISTTVIISTTTQQTIDYACTETGRFPNYKSEDCSTYFLCTVNSDGNLVATLVHCPDNTLFSWDTNQCVSSILYSCSIESLSSSTMQTTLMPSSTVTPEPTSEPNEFACLGIGRYPNPTSIDCKSYYICIPTVEGNIIALPAQCPSTTVFSAESKKCVATTEYQCPTIATSTTVQSSTETTTVQVGFICPEEGRFPDTESKDCATYYLCVQDASGTITGTLTYCPASTIFSWVFNKCVSTDQFACPNTMPSTEQTPTSVISTTVMIPTTTQQIIECTEQGRFPNYESEDCSTYFLCIVDSDGQLVGTLAHCPENSLFSWYENRCVPSTIYSCPSEPSTSPTTQTPGISPSTITSQPTIPETFTCTSVGRFPDVEELSCQTYKYCLLTAVGTFLEYTFSCPVNTLFDPEQSRCSANYACSYTTPMSTTTEAATTMAHHDCSSDGRFPDPEAQSCETYVYCLQTVAGNFLKYTFKCPVGTLFNPMERRCSSIYICPSEE